jgi:hypothetical protein
LGLPAKANGLNPKYKGPESAGHFGAFKQELCRSPCSSRQLDRTPHINATSNRKGVTRALFYKNFCCCQGPASRAD